MHGARPKGGYIARIILSCMILFSLSTLFTEEAEMAKVLAAGGAAGLIFLLLASFANEGKKRRKAGWEY